MVLGYTENISAIKLRLLALISEKNINDLLELINDSNIADFANHLEDLKDEDFFWILSNVNNEDAANIIPLLQQEKIISLVRYFTKNKLREIFHEMAKDDAVDIIEELPINEFRKALASLTEKDRVAINKLMQYEDDLVGSIMSVEFVDLNENWTVQQASNYLRDKYEDTEEVRYYYVIDNDNKLVGFVDVQTIFFAKSGTKLKEIMNKNYIYVSSYDNVEKAIEYFKKYDIVTLPVISKAAELIGFITYDDLIDVVEEETTEDIEKQAGIIPTAQSYMTNSPFKISMSRISWLVILLISSTISQIILTAFQDYIDDILTIRITTLLVSLVPVISGTSGNAGSQAVTSIVRSMSLRELDKQMYWKIISKESKISFYVGFILASINSLRMIAFYGIQTGIVTKFDLILTLTTSLCLMISIALSKIIGASLPFLALILKKDPAAMATPMLTTLVDAMSTTIFFSVSMGVLALI